MEVEIMNGEAYTFALKSALAEIQNICSDIKTSFLFDKEATIIAGGTETPEATLKRVAGSLGGILEKADAIGGLDSLLIEGNEGNVHIFSVNDMYLTMIVSKHADIQYLETVARVLIPTVIKLLSKLGPTPLNKSSTLTEPKRYEKLEEETENERKPMRRVELVPNQLIAESFGGIFTRGDNVQISENIMSQWRELIDGRDINLVELESLKGATRRCKVKTIQDAELENRAIIRIPERVCDALNIKKGELVKVRPIIN
ncbi:MAG: hypothetical protein ACLFU9_07245 [Candidatus Bathyarchaeia archaeon]